MNALANLLGKVDANGALLVAISGGSVGPVDAISFTGGSSINGVTANTLKLRATGTTDVLTLTTTTVTSALPVVLSASSSLRFNDANTAIGIPAANSLGFTTSAVEQGRLNNSGIWQFGRSAVASALAQPFLFSGVSGAVAAAVFFETTLGGEIIFGTAPASTRTWHIENGGVSPGTLLRFYSQDNIDAAGAFVHMALGAAAPFIRTGMLTDAMGNVTSTATGNLFQYAQLTSTASSGTVVPFAITPTYNQSGTAAGTDLLINRTETAVGSGAQLLVDMQVAGSSRFSVRNDGVAFMSSGFGSNFFSSSTAFAVRTTGTLANGAAAQVGTLMNAPTAGNPTKWIPIDDNGTTRYIPTWP